ncbi:MAG: YggS family pyridoxal phosphate-dependent enzyme [Anaerotardibacter sp.]
MSTATRYQHLRKELDSQCEKVGRKPEEVTLLAVSKTVDIDQVEIAISAGAHAFGENRPDELLRKKAAFPQEEWHFIGNIQSRRIGDIVSAADLIHSVCKESHLAKIDKAARELGKVQKILLEVNVSGEESKSGFSADDVYSVLCSAASFENIEVCGLMTMAPRSDEDAVLFTFSGLSALREKLQQKLDEQQIGITLSELSMGMTEDWKTAVEYGSTCIRLGRAVFDDSFE